MDSRALGQWGEQQAARFLRRKGYSIVARNFRCRAGEIDIVAKGKGYVVFAEVKLRKSDEFAEAREFVTAAKQRRIISTALLWLRDNPDALQPRFDVLEVYAPDGQKTLRPEINHIEDAFC